MRISIAEREELIDAALGRVAPDLVIKGGKLINVNTREIHRADIIIKGKRIAAVEDEVAVGAGVEVIHADDQFLSPGFIDPHIHLESSSLTVTELTRAIVPRGTTTIVEDPHEIANVLGTRGIQLFLDEAANLPINLLLRVPGRVPALPGIETTGAELSLVETKELLAWDEAVCLAGDINPSLILGKDRGQLEKIDHAVSLNKTIGGQSPGLKGGALNAFVAAGPEDSHVSLNTKEVVDVLRHGMSAILTTRPFLFGPDDFVELAQEISNGNLDTRSLLFCTDDTQANLLIEEGHLDHLIRVAIRKGVDPISAFQMATINVAQWLRLTRELGSISPGRIADILILDDVQSVEIDKVLVGGKLVAEQGSLVEHPPRFLYPQWSKETMHIGKTVQTEDLQIRVDKGLDQVRARVLEAGLPKTSDTEILSVSAGIVMPAMDRDILSIAVLDRHAATGNVGKGFIGGTGIKDGALASSVSHDGHNVWVIGTDHHYMATAVNKLATIGGGYVAVKGGEVAAEIELPVAGLISEASFESMASEFKQFEDFLIEELQCRLRPLPLYWFSLVPLVNIPDIGITDKGLVDAFSFEFLEPVVEVNG